MDRDQLHVLLLHGYGGRGDDLAFFSSLSVEPTPHWYFPKAPIVLDPGHLAWYPLDFSCLEQGYPSSHHQAEQFFPKDLQQATKHLDTLIHNLAIPLHQLVIGGFSQGAVLAIDWFFHTRADIKGLAIFSGSLISHYNWDQVTYAPKTSFFQSHGVQDQLLPFQGALALEQLLLEQGLHGSLHACDAGHEIPLSTREQFRLFLQKLSDNN